MKQRYIRSLNATSPGSLRVSSALLAGTLFLVLSAMGQAAAAATDAAQPIIEPSTQAAEQIQIEAVTEYGYEDEQGRVVLDLLERDRAYLELRLTTADGQPLADVRPSIIIDGTSRLFRDAAATDSNGVLTFEVSAGQMGLDRLYVRHGTARKEFLINIISLKAAGFPEPITVEGGLGWEVLMQARIRWDESQMIADFPEEIEAKAGKMVKISGFILPLEPTEKQRHFLVTSNPPSCFFHVPGGPAGSIEVHAAEGIEVSWDPVILEGRFEPLRTSKEGVVYRLSDARLVSP